MREVSRTQDPALCDPKDFDQKELVVMAQLAIILDKVILNEMDKRQMALAATVNFDDYFIEGHWKELPNSWSAFTTRHMTDKKLYQSEMRQEVEKAGERDELQGQTRRRCYERIDL